MQTIGERIKSVRKNNDLTQTQFSERLCISRPHVTKIENSKENASGTVIRLISVLFEVNEEWLKSGKVN